MSKPPAGAVCLSLSEALQKGPPPAGNLAVPIFSHGSLEVEMYSPKGHDPQQPHDRDEVLSGRSRVRSLFWALIYLTQRQRLESAPMNLPNEVIGKWIVDPSGRIVGDRAENQIWEVVRNHLTRMGDRESGWTILYRDPSDDSFWELTFPQSEMHGGGPAKLTRIASEQVPQLYPTLELS